MGLDMYLNVQRYISHADREQSGTIKSKIYDDDKTVEIETPLSRVKYLILEGIYWRKANQIHNWFVRNCCNGADDCLPHYVTEDNLTELLGLCKQVQADHSLAEALLPPCGGFFFGGTDLDEWYFSGIDQTITDIEKLLSETNSYDEFYYQSSW